MVDSRKSVASAILLGTLGVISFIIQPAEVEGLTAFEKISDGAANALVAYEMMGIAVATIVLAVWGHRFNWRHLLIYSLAIGIAGDALSALTVGTSLLGLCRAISGLGHGGLISLSFTFLGLSRHVERNLALYMVISLTYSACAIMALPFILAKIQFSGLFFFFAAATALGFLAVPNVPTSAEARQYINPIACQLSPIFLASALLAVLAYNMGMGAAWANLSLIGVRADVPIAEVNRALAASQFAGIAGALAAMFYPHHAGRSVPIFAGTIGAAACIGAIMGQPSVLAYSVSVCLLIFSTNFVQPVIIAAVGDFDCTERMIPAAVAIQMVGLGLGPLVSAYQIERQGFGLVEQSCILFLIISFIAMMLPVFRHKSLLRARNN